MQVPIRRPGPHNSGNCPLTRMRTEPDHLQQGSRAADASVSRSYSALGVPCWPRSFTVSGRPSAWIGRAVPLFGTVSRAPVPPDDRRRWGEDALPHRVAGRGWREDRPHPDGGIGPNRPHLISPYAMAGVAEPVGAAEAPPAAACHAAAACDMPPASATCRPPPINARSRRRSTRGTVACAHARRADRRGSTRQSMPARAGGGVCQGSWTVPRVVDHAAVAAA